MSDLEQRLTDALRPRAPRTPRRAVGLADGARTRARQRRRTRLAGGAAVVALAVGVPGAVLAWAATGRRRAPGRRRRDHRRRPGRGGSGLPNGYHAESWHGVTIEVPNTWGYGSPHAWCADGGEVDGPAASSGPGR